MSDPENLVLSLGRLKAMLSTAALGVPSMILISGSYVVVMEHNETSWGSRCAPAEGCPADVEMMPKSTAKSHQNRPPNDIKAKARSSPLPQVASNDPRGIRNPRNGQGATSKEERLPTTNTSTSNEQRATNNGQQATRTNNTQRAKSNEQRARSAIRNKRNEYTKTTKVSKPKKP